jgi:hypothetical protein
MAPNSLKLIKSDGHWDNFWSEVSKEEQKQQTLQPQLVSTKNEKEEARGVPILQFLHTNSNDLERETGMPEDWCKVIVALMNMQQPKIISWVRWSTIRQVLAYLFSQEYVLLKSIIAHNWTIAHIFGCDSNTPEMAFHNMGLVMLFKETDKLDNISDKAIMIRNSRGVITSYSRPHQNARNNQVLIYELL